MFSPHFSQTNSPTLKIPAVLEDKHTCLGLVQIYRKCTKNIDSNLKKRKEMPVWLYGIKRPFQHCFSYITVASALVHAFLGVLLTSTLHNIFSKPLAAFPHDHYWNSRQQNESQWLSLILGKYIGRARDGTSNPLFSSPQRYRQLWGSAGKKIMFSSRHHRRSCNFLK